MVKATVLLAKIEDFTAVNTIYSECKCAKLHIHCLNSGYFIMQYCLDFVEPYPARAAYAAADLPKGALVEIECVAVQGPFE